MKLGESIRKVRRKETPVKPQISRFLRVIDLNLRSDFGNRIVEPTRSRNKPTGVRTIEIEHVKKNVRNCQQSARDIHNAPKY